MVPEQVVVVLVGGLVVVVASGAAGVLDLVVWVEAEGLAQPGLDLP